MGKLHKIKKAIKKDPEAWKHARGAIVWRDTTGAIRVSPQVGYYYPCFNYYKFVRKIYNEVALGDSR